MPYRVTTSENLPFCHDSGGLPRGRAKHTRLRRRWTACGPWRVLRRPAGRGGARRPMGGLLQLLAAAGAAATSGSAWRCAAGAGAGACWTRGRAGAGARADARAPYPLFEPFTLRGRTAPRELVAPQHELYGLVDASDPPSRALCAHACDAAGDSARSVAAVNTHAMSCRRPTFRATFFLGEFTLAASAARACSVRLLDFFILRI